MDDKSGRPAFSPPTPRAIEDFSHKQEQNGVRIGYEYYWPEGKTFYNVVAVEFGILNGADEAIQVLPTDCAFSYQGQPIKSTQLEVDAAAPSLVDRGLSFMDWLGISGSPAVPQSVVMLLPVMLLTLLNPAGTVRVLRDYLAWRRGKAALRRASFEYGSVPAGQYRHGLLFFRFVMPRKPTASWREDLGLTIDVLQHQPGPLAAEEAVPYRFEPFLPSIPLIVVTLAVQFALLAGVCGGFEVIVSGGLNVLPLICGGSYLMAALLAILGLAVDYR